MFSLQKFLGKGDEFFDLFERSAQQCCAAVEILKRILAEPNHSALLTDLRAVHRENKRIKEQVDEMVVRTFVTILEREDIESLANALYRIPKPIEKFAERFLIANSIVSADLFQSQSAMLESATSTVSRMVRELRKGVNLAKMKGLNSRLQQTEAEADTLEIELLRDLYQNTQEPLKVMIMKDLYDLLERVVDRCRDTGNVMTYIFLKNS